MMQLPLVLVPSHLVCPWMKILKPEDVRGPCEHVNEECTLQGVYHHHKVDLDFCVSWDVWAGQNLVEAFIMEVSPHLDVMSMLTGDNYRSLVHVENTVKVVGVPFYLV